MLARHRIVLLLLPVTVIVINGSYCKSNQNKILKERYVSRNGRVLNMTLHWASDPARAASALFAVILRQGLGYQHVYLRQSPHLDLRHFAENVPHRKTRIYDEIILALSTSWVPGSAPYWAPHKGAVSGLAGPRLEQLGTSSIPVQQRLHVFVAEKYRNCTHDVTQWNFYTNASALKECGFTNTALSNHSMKRAVVYGLDLNNSTKNLHEFAKELNFVIKNLSRRTLFQKLRTDNQSFLFMDYAIWSEHGRVKAIPQPFCLLTSKSKCLLKQSTAVSMRVGDVSILTEFAPAIIQLAYNIIKKPKIIREILEIECEGNYIENAAEKWAAKHINVTDLTLKYARKYSDIAIFYCSNDPDFQKYDNLIKKLSETLLHLYGDIFKIRLMRYPTNCTDENYVRNKLKDYTSSITKQQLIGAVVANVMNVAHVAKTIYGFNVPVLFYDAIGINTASSESTWLTSGNSRHLALALRYFFVTLKWSRIAVLSEPTETAKRFIHDLRSVDDIALGNHPVPLGLSKYNAVNILKELKNGNENVHIFFVNANYKDAATILAAAASLGMNSTKDYAWIVREWRPNNKTVDIKHFTFSFWCRCGKDASESVGFPEIRNKIDSLFPNCTWPPHGATLADAIFTLLKGFKSTILKCPQIRDDLRHRKANEVFEKSLIGAPIQGLTQNFTYKGHSVEETVVFVDEWQGHLHDHHGRWRVNAASGHVNIEHQLRAAYPLGDQPHDGSSKCFVTSGDPYLPTCHDWEWKIAVIFIMLIPLTLLMIYRLLRRRLKDHEKKIICEILALRQRYTAALTTYLINRSAFSLHHELGSGRFGYVRLAWLRIHGNAPRYVAAKVLREHQNETEILHEACVLASLHHENIVRLVGVCIDKDPPLILMEVAFFGDLLQYLQDRRYLAEAADSFLTQTDQDNDEAAHVSAEALTRLARQAASALEYLAFRGVIHRDLRASNCLVDSNRSLKLADFGMARNIKAIDSNGGTEYACARRGVFPVLWMAPESLIYGIFSPASDVWALGVLVFELVTLGARPFGDMSALSVTQYVTSGGEPSMPRNASPQTLALVWLCWQREPERRPTAADMVAYLAERPYALRPALDDDNKQPTKAVSSCRGFSLSNVLPY